MATRMYACPKCQARIEVQVPAAPAGGKLYVKCDHCGAEKPLHAFQREFANQQAEQERLRRQQEDFKRDLQRRTQLEAERNAKREEERRRKAAQAAEEAECALQAGVYEYKVEILTEGMLGTVFLGASKVPQRKLEELLNKHGASGWHMDFMVVETRRMLLFWTREAVIITFSRKIA